MRPQPVLVTGGAGFIGSHTCVELLDAGNDVVVIDDYSNSHPGALERVREITGKTLTAWQADLRDRAALSSVFTAHPIEAVIHFAAKKAVGESTRIPLDYIDINVGGTTNLIRTMHQFQVSRLVYSSSCSIYGDGPAAPLAESAPANPTNPYALSKLICEELISEACRRLPQLSVIALRYFNPIGAHPSGVLGEDPVGVPNNVMPYLSQIAVGRLPELSVFGGDYPTHRMVRRSGTTSTSSMSRTHTGSRSSISITAPASGFSTSERAPVCPFWSLSAPSPKRVGGTFPTALWTGDRATWPV